MTVTLCCRPFPPRLVLLAVAAAWLATGAPALAHAELVSSDPADGAEVEGAFGGPIVLTFSETLADNSRAELLDGSGDEVAEAQIPADQPDRLVFELDTPLAPGEYSIQITAIAADGHIERPTIGFTVLEPEPSPTPAPTVTPGPSASAAPSVPPSTAPSPSPAPSSNGTPVASSTDVLFPLIAAVVAIVALGALLLRNRRARVR